MQRATSLVCPFCDWVHTTLGFGIISRKVFLNCFSTAWYSSMLIVSFGLPVKEFWIVFHITSVEFPNEQRQY